MKRKDKIIVIIIFLVLIIPIIINEINIRPKLKLIDDVEKILLNYSKIDKSNDSPYEVIINNGYKIDNKYTEVEGTGVIFVDKDVSVMLSRNNMCAMKLPYQDKIMFQNESCPQYKMFNGIKLPIVNSNDGLYKQDNLYLYKGNVDNNYVLFNNIYFRIYSFKNNTIKLVKDSPDKIEISNIFSIYEMLENNYSSLLKSENIININWIINNINGNKIDTSNEVTNKKIGTLSLEEYLNSFNNSYEIKDNEVITRGETYLSSDGLLSCDNCNTNISYVYPIIVIKDIILKSGTGTKKDPYIFK